MLSNILLKLENWLKTNHNIDATSLFLHIIFFWFMRDFSQISIFLFQRLSLFFVSLYFILVWIIRQLRVALHEWENAIKMSEQVLQLCLSVWEVSLCSHAHRNDCYDVVVPCCFLFCLYWSKIYFLLLNHDHYLQLKFSN